MGRRVACVPRGWDPARIALLWPAAFAVHQLRYMLAYGHAADLELQRTGHAYVHSVVPWLVGLIALAAGCFLWAIGRAMARQTIAARFTVSFAALWMVCSAALVAVFVGQELLEGFFAVGHPAGLAGVFGYGGWWAVPAAVCVGLVLAAVFHGARWIIDRIACRGRGTGLAGRCPHVQRPSLPVLWYAVSPLVAGWSSRGPPGLS